MGEFGEYSMMDWSELQFILFAFCCIFNIIVLLNLLIAIISETFARISERSE